MVGRAIFDQQLTDSQISGLLVGLKVKGVAADELTGLAQVMQGKWNTDVGGSSWRNGQLRDWRRSFAKLQYQYNRSLCFSGWRNPDG